MPTTWKPVFAFFALAILLLALVPVLSFATGLTMDFDAAAASATEKTGVEQTSNLLVVIRLALAEPALWLLLVGSSVPSLAALVVCGATRKPTLSRLVSRLAPMGPGATTLEALRAYLVLFLTMPLCLLGVYALRQVLPGSTDYLHPDGFFGAGLAVALLTAALLDQGAVLEELGWRGYGQSAIQEYLLSPLGAAVVVGLAWGLWHVPRDVVVGVIGRLGMAQYLVLYLPSFVLGTVAVSIISAYFMNRAGGSVWPAIVAHGLANDAAGVAGAVNLHAALTPYHQITKALPLLAFCVLLVALSGRRLGRLPHSAADTEAPPRG